ncbi:alpha/beta hydrolase [Nocardia nova]|uniref:Alpha/beta hydrolase n=2 Tax=Nocardiaceae TaxID=85025 RepID=A0A2S5ZXM1_9NOCA|nr:alpha/beta hydrolase [Nocardia nova]PPJ22651.1 alpha/beta hydrolase [Nocardia nova]
MESAQETSFEETSKTSCKDTSLCDTIRDMNASLATELTPGAVRSEDGTRIGYLRVGRGPALVLLHGSNQSGRSLTGLALALADEFTVYLPDRRGRGASGPHRPDHGIRTEVADLAAVVQESGADMVFGISSSGLIVLEAARTLPQIRKIALYEPALLRADETRYTDWLPRFDREMAAGKVGAALITCMYGFDLAPAAMRVMPRGLLAALTDKAMSAEDKKSGPGDVTMRALAPTLRWDCVILGQMAGSLTTFANIDQDVLLMSGTKKGPRFLMPALDDLAATLPHNRRVTLPGLDHGSPADPSQTNGGGNPTAVAPSLREFFAQP